jgi:hypothetical protein
MWVVFSSFSSLSSFISFLELESISVVHRGLILYFFFSPSSSAVFNACVFRRLHRNFLPFFYLCALKMNPTPKEERREGSVEY